MNELPPVICRIGRTVTPGASIGTRNIVRPACLAADGSVRVTATPTSATGRAGGPHLVAVEHPVAVALDGAGAHGGQVGARLGLGEELAGDQVGAQHRAHVALALLGSPPLRDGRGDQLLGDGEHLGAARHVEGLLLLPEGERVGHRQAAAAVLLRPGERAPAGVVLGLLVRRIRSVSARSSSSGPVLEDGDRVGSDAPLGRPSGARRPTPATAALAARSRRVMAARSSSSSQTASTVQALMPGAP